MQVVDLLPAGHGISEEAVKRWVSAELAKAAALRDLDDQLYPDEDSPDRVERARRLHAAWRQWAEEAAALLRRILSDNTSIQTRPNILKLRQEVALAEALVEQPPEMILESLKEARSGGVMTIEEVRRELRARYHA